MTVDWDEPLVPPSRSVRRSCTCSPTPTEAARASTWPHLAYVVADAVDGDPSLLLEWRGCTLGDDVTEPDVVPELPAGDRWIAGPLPELGEARALPIGSVLKRLGASGSSSTASICATLSSPPTPRSPG